MGSGLTPTLQLCSAHKPGQMIEVCKTCAAALAMGRPEVAKQFIVPVPVTALTRYSTRSGEKQPSLFLPAGIIEESLLRTPSTQACSEVSVST